MNSCNNCAKRTIESKNACPWNGTYNHRGPHGEKI